MNSLRGCASVEPPPVSTHRERLSPQWDVTAALPSTATATRCTSRPRPVWPVYDRGPSGQLSYRRTLPGVDRDTRLFWDAQTESLIAASCNALRRFPAAASGRGLTSPRMIAGRIPCTSRQLATATLLRDATGSFIHFAGPLGVATLRFNRDRSAMAFMRGTPVKGVVAATLGAGDAFLYAATEDGLRVFARDRNTGVLTTRGAVQPTDANDAAPVRFLKSDVKGRYLLPSPRTGAYVRTA